MKSFNLKLIIPLLLLCIANTHAPYSGCNDISVCNGFTSFKTPSKLFSELLEEKQWTFKYAVGRCNDLPHIKVLLNAKLRELSKNKAETKYLIDEGEDQQCYLKVKLTTDDYKEAYNFMKKLKEWYKHNMGIVLIKLPESTITKAKYFHHLCKDNLNNPEVMEMKKFLDYEQKNNNRLRKRIYR